MNYLRKLAALLTFHNIRNVWFHSKMPILRAAWQLPISIWFFIELCKFHWMNCLYIYLASVVLGLAWWFGVEFRDYKRRESLSDWKNRIRVVR